MEKVKTVFIRTIEKSARKVLIKRGIKATGYFAYCEEVGCDVWELLTRIKTLEGEPVCLWLPPQYIKSGTSEYVQGVELPADFNDEIPEGFDLIDLPTAKYLVFQGEPFEEKDYGQAIMEVQSAINRYNPVSLGFAWDKSNPRIQLEPIGTRGYIELMPVK
ncbi:hypothetical protein [Candidatus Enterococcus murrayae]|uniref:Bacterial transcription activator effector binding domain-containing protein n=1 Tax=Candidatus Enterococcus murrayae TaxID=2815321 RepID=A0ABS3HJX9_9ENTE|nr:hypothetical protein [Enterococcus sp. MJM16]MBO0453239.1 hypothetical protein [Enterococcus sp. MJM16]